MFSRQDFTSEQLLLRFWWTLVSGTLLPLADGRMFQLHAPGYPGGPAGPDVRDAVLRDLADEHGEVLVGDIEFHLRAYDWFSHTHHLDCQYDRVILHVVLWLDFRGPPAERSDGFSLPVCTLWDLPEFYLRLGAWVPFQPPQWPCQAIWQYLDAEALSGRLRQAGIWRFQEKSGRFLSQLSQQASPKMYDRYLLAAIAEGLGYGRDREFFCTLGKIFLGEQEGSNLKSSGVFSSLDRRRVRSLLALQENWQDGRGWRRILELCLSTEGCCGKERYQQFRSLFVDVGISEGRANILLCNVLFPFVYAVANWEQQPALAEYVLTLYREHPGLPANSVTRRMSKQLLLSHQPRGSCIQQGLHFVYQRTCKQKYCERCLLKQN